MVENPNNQDLFPSFEKELQTPKIYDVTNDRVFETIYQNKTGKTLRVMIIVPQEIKVKGDGAEVFFYCDSVTPPMVIPYDAYITNFDMVTDLDIGISQNVICDVPPNYYYQLHKVDSGMGLSQIGSWMEVY